MVNLRNCFIKNLTILIEDKGYTPELVANYALTFYLENKIEDKYFMQVVQMLMVMDAGDEFELSEKECLELLYGL